MKDVKLSSLIEGKYKMAAGFAPGKYVHGNCTIDTTTCTEAEAEAFVAAGSDVLVKIDTKPVAKKV